MGANREQRRRQEREQIRKWKEQGRYEQIISLQRNGITQSDLDKAYNNGYQEGYLYASECLLKKVYAAIAQELITAGNSTDDVVNLLHNVDHRFALMFDADEEIDAVYEQIGVRFNVSRKELEDVPQ